MYLFLFLDTQSDNASFHQNQWRSDLGLIAETASSQASKEKTLFQASYALAVSTEDFIIDNKEKTEILPVISKPYSTSKSLDMSRTGSGAFHPSKEDFKVPKPIDYLRLQKQIQDPKGRQQLKIMNRIFQSNMKAQALATQNDTKKLEGARLSAEQPIVNRIDTIIENTAEVQTVNGKEHITIELPNPHSSNVVVDSSDESLLVPFNTPNNSAEMSRLAQGRFSRKSVYDPSPLTVGVRGSYEHPRYIYQRKGKDYKYRYSNSKGNGIAHGSTEMQCINRTCEER